VPNERVSTEGVRTSFIDLIECMARGHWRWHRVTFSSGRGTCASIDLGVPWMDGVVPLRHGHLKSNGDILSLEGLEAPELSFNPRYLAQDAFRDVLTQNMHRTLITPQRLTLKSDLATVF
jgi:hypothetical protein